MTNLIPEKKGSSVMPNIDPIIHIDKQLCTGCRRCASVCPVDAITGEAGTRRVLMHIAA